MVKITDGDTLTILTGAKEQIKIRLAEIDTPESRQPYGSRSKESLSRLCFGKDVTVKVQTTDRYGRKVGRIYVDGLDVSAEMVKIGAAWVYRKYAKDKSLYKLEDDARRAKVGLWSLPETQRVPPWEWRKKSPRTGVSTKKASIKAECGDKTKCNQMTSCEEAKFYLNECGLTRLDGDKNGLPCEALCR